MLTFSKDRDPDLQSADLNVVVAEVVDLMQARASERGVELFFSPAVDLGPLLFDPENMHHAVLNVVTNAIDACDDRPQARVHVRVTRSVDGELAQVIVEDNGHGIDPDDLPKLFQIFQSTKGNRGTGLGLSVSQKILQEHGGEIVVESEVDAGSQFTLQFPAIVPSEEFDPATATQALP
jgi:signal transduction histidine kinase